MPMELDKGHDIPIFGPGATLSLAERFELAREVVRRYGRQGPDTSTPGRRTAERRLRLGRRDRLA
jgi:hypothetical protein